MATIVALALWAGKVPSVAADSLYQADSYRSIVIDHKARHAGDNLTVIILESASASTSANTSTARSTGLSGTVAGTNTVRSGSIDIGQEFDGGGTIQRSGEFVAQITATVVSVYDNGDLYIKGEQLVEVNDERQHITIEGRVRPVDIASDNTVVSTRVNNAKVSYLGKGVLGHQQKPNIFIRFFTWLGIL